MLVWFLTLAITGIAQIVRHPSVFAAINPLHAAHFLTSHGVGSLIILGSVSERLQALRRFMRT